MTKWPKDDKRMSFEELTFPVYKAIRKAYKLSPKDYGDRINWTGPELPKSMGASCLTYDKLLTRENLEYSEQDQGRDPLEEIVGVAVQLGIEQGRRIIKEDLKIPIDLLEMVVRLVKTR